MHMENGTETESRKCLETSATRSSGAVSKKFVIDGVCPEPVEEGWEEGATRIGRSTREGGSSLRSIQKGRSGQGSVFATEARQDTASCLPSFYQFCKTARAAQLERGLENDKPSF